MAKVRHRPSCIPQVDSGHVHLLNRTLLERNTAPDGISIHLSENGTLEYTLPAPPGRWVGVHRGFTFVLEAGAVEDLDLPYACSAGVVGGTSPTQQSGPGCASTCPSGYFCPGMTMHPEPCFLGAYVRPLI